MRTAADDDHLITTVSTAGLYRIRDCPVKIYRATGELLLEVTGCDATDLHELSPDGNVFIACDIRNAIFEDKPMGDGSAPGIRKLRFWHNGSIVEASFFSNGGV